MAGKMASVEPIPQLFFFFSNRFLFITMLPGFEVPSMQYSVRFCLVYLRIKRYKFSPKLMFCKCL